MRRLFLALVFAPLTLHAEIVTIDFVKIVNDNDAEARYYYENNWKRHRVAAVEQGVIKSYQLLYRSSDDGEADILLITEYASQQQYEDREKNFEAIMSVTQAGGRRLLNDKQPAEFREIYDGGVFTMN